MLILSLVMIRWIVPNASSKVIDYACDPENAEILDIKQFGFSKAEAYQALEAMGEEGRGHYVSFHRREDLAFPFVYGLYLTLTVFLLLGRRWKPQIRYLILIIPIIAMLADLTENHHVVMLVGEFPDLGRRTLILASSANAIKWGALILTLLIIGILVVLKIISFIKRPETRNQN